MKLGRRIAAWVGALLVLAVTFIAYLNPHFAVTLADQIRSCF
jgi:type II secretory pathway component PulM